MALQGTIDTFPLTDVLALLASSSRSGQLTVSGDRGSGTVWIHDQAVLGGQLEDGRSVGPERIIFELLRFTEGSFEFNAVDRTDFPQLQGISGSVDECISAATKMIEDWVEIEALVPSIAHRVDLVPELPDETLTIDRALWRVLVMVSRCSSVANLSEELGVDDYEGSALVASLVQERLVEVTEPGDPYGFLAPNGDQALASDEHRDGSSEGEGRSDGSGDLRDDGPLVEGLTAEEASAGNGHWFPDHFPIDDLIMGEEPEAGDAWSSPALEGSLQSGHDGLESQPLTGDPVSQIDILPDGPGADTTVPSGTFPGDSSFDGWDQLVGTHGTQIDPNADDAAEEVLRQMSKLSPKAAEAIAAALGTTDPVVEDASVAAVGQLESKAGQPSSADSAPDDPGPISFLDSF